MKINWNLVSNGLAALGTLGTAVGILVAVNTYHADHDRSRRQTSFQLIGEVRKYLRDERDLMIKAFPGLYSGVDMKILSPREAEDLYNACSERSSKSFTCDQLGAAGNYLNLLEYVTTAYTNKIADERMIEESLAPTILADYEYFENFVKTVEKNKGRRA